jgi:hypothetical protein
MELYNDLAIQAIQSKHMLILQYFLVMARFCKKLAHQTFTYPDVFRGKESAGFAKLSNLQRDIASKSQRTVRPFPEDLTFVETALYADAALHR